MSARDVFRWINETATWVTRSVDAWLFDPILKPKKRSHPGGAWAGLSTQGMNISVGADGAVMMSDGGNSTIIDGVVINDNKNNKKKRKAVVALDDSNPETRARVQVADRVLVDTRETIGRKLRKVTIKVGYEDGSTDKIVESVNTEDDDVSIAVFVDTPAIAGAINASCADVYVLGGSAEKICVSSGSAHVYGADHVRSVDVKSGDAFIAGSVGNVRVQAGDVHAATVEYADVTAGDVKTAKDAAALLRNLTKVTESAVATARKIDETWQLCVHWQPPSEPSAPPMEAAYNDGENVTVACPPPPPMQQLRNLGFTVENAGPKTTLEDVLDAAGYYGNATTEGNDND
jgi:co-chaperonin GroES (HSP10)